LDEPPQTVPQGQEVLPSRSPLSLSLCIADFCFQLFSFCPFKFQLFSMSAFQLFSFSAFARLSFSFSAFN
jgi:hypothetical protein